MKIALVGNQNCGKTTLFNLLTGSNQKVGNWPGVTVEYKEGIIKGTNLKLVDLPGIYSLSPYTEEEGVSRRYVFLEEPDLIINIVDATNLERSLYLTTMLLETNANVVLALNMADILEKNGITIDTKKLEDLLDTSVVKISALKNTGIEELKDLVKNKKYRLNKHHEIFSKDIENSIKTICKHVHMRHTRFSAIKMLERDPLLSITKPYEVDEEIKKIEDERKMEVEEVIADERYKFIVDVKNKSTTSHPVPESITHKLDKILLNKYLAIPIFIIIMGLVYALSVGLVGKYLTTLIGDGFNNLSDLVYNNMLISGSSEWSASLMSRGIISGVGSVLSFLPQIIVLFTCISILEATGYMSRIAFFFDRVFHSFGLSGKSLIPFIVGCGCSVPGIMTSRIVEDSNEKKMTIILTPLMPCSAKLPVISLFAGYIIGNSNGGLSFLIAFSCYIIAIFLIILYAAILNKFYFKSDSNSFLSELPDYKLPNFKYVFKDVLDKTLDFLLRAGTIILFSSIIIWFLISFTPQFVFISSKGPYTISDSILSYVGRGIAWVFYPMTGGKAGDYTWAVAVSSIQGLIAREQIVSTMNIIEASTKGLGIEVFGFFKTYPVTAVAFLFFTLYSAPCFGAIGATYKETGSIGKTFFIVMFQFTTAWIIASLIGGLGSLVR